ncbi:class I SAM-dependent methyltransferase [Flavobacterium sp. 3HN19-14]|uniref:class I SAM-dependent methyltransferase n=1 Tax=Flavobacterium sp. 3HN19-14 TaxID=3448133 RepID=UPI003EE22AF8
MTNIYTNCKVCSGNTQLINQKYNLLQCGKCRLIFCGTIYSQQEFIEVYDALYNRENAIYSNHSKVEYQMLLENKKIKIGYNRSRLISKNVLNGKCRSVLEIGSGIGLIGCYLVAYDKKINYLGIEIDKESYEKSRQFNLNTLNGDFTLMETIDAEFDVVMLWEVFEHLQDLKLFMQLAFKKLSPGGKIILSVPNYNKIFNYPDRPKDEIYQDKPPVHLNFLTPENITNIFIQQGFTNPVASVKKFPYINFKSIRFYTDFIKGIFNKYNGSTIYFEAQKPF